MGGFVDSVGTLFGAGPTTNNGQYTATGINPATTGVVSPVTQGQYDSSYNQALGGIDQQQQLLNALQAQNGIGNQSSVFNQLQGVANGTGPNPAQAALAQATANNVAQQGALMGSQRGSSANPALLARQVAQQGAGIQQNAAGQAATLQAQQQLGALGQLGGIANTQAAQQIGQTNALSASQQNEQQQLLNAIAQSNNANVGLQSNINTSNQNMAGINANNTAKVFGGLFQGGSGAAAAGGTPAPTPPPIPPAAAAAAYRGGKVSDDGTIIPPHLKTISSTYHQDFYSNAPKQMSAGGVASVFTSDGTVPGKAKVKGDSLKNDRVPAYLSAGEVVLPRSVMQAKDPVKAAAQFVAETLKKEGNKKTGREEGDFKSALKKAIAGRKSK